MGVDGRKVCWITGASQGLGLALAQELASRGYKLILTARRAKELGEAIATLPGTGHEALPADITDRVGMKKLVDDIAKRHGRLDMAVLNAGTHQPMLPGSYDDEVFDKLININIHGTLNSLLPVINVMKVQKSGTIAVVSSVAGYIGLPTASAYGLTKAGIINLCETLHVELAPLGIDLKMVNPGFVRTPLTDKNDFPMPFLMEAKDAAKAMAKGLEGKQFEVAFPRKFVWMLKFLRFLPYQLSLPITKKFMPKGTKP
ncbi:MAG TPA: oxidoreductase [Alphaproteobacteria bacterium]|nr:oxidoreductase [Paracoccaceae bacterium]RCL81167.1 MAG: SDR family NAD(P)-dependent oxidoreductase [SAR116 cluster bacterium]RPH14283.1 MAG: SDR family NAD(P)-dependent oxidoreductase [Alphaproteobacteria bacterium TMED150]HCJ62585.1 oxidoreductase [Alphaproteobacteria bacterium]HCY48528.1 oxidoreductase [Alphaproteobacteria bacterium]|tara:strand:- start:1394 stop:2167 length:774 start_codon:yes stop_codon:yes gene_type:complete